MGRKLYLKSREPFVIRQLYAMSMLFDPKEVMLIPNAS